MMDKDGEIKAAEDKNTATGKETGIDAAMKN